MLIFCLSTAHPEWTAEPQPVDAGVEEKAGFECAADGKPQPTISWFINGKPIDSKYVMFHV